MTAPVIHSPPETDRPSRTDRCELAGAVHRKLLVGPNVLVGVDEHTRIIGVSKEIFGLAQTIGNISAVSPLA
jgi:hypothetical protein